MNHFYLITDCFLLVVRFADRPERCVTVPNHIKPAVANSDREACIVSADGSFWKAVTLQLHKTPDPAREVPAEAVHMELCVDISAFWAFLRV